jgi:hypothetical protein
VKGIIWATEQQPLDALNKCVFITESHLAFARSPSVRKRGLHPARSTDKRARAQLTKLLSLN